MNRPTLDVSSERLKLRTNIEEAIDSIITDCGFEKVNFDNKIQGTVAETTKRTPWKRSLTLYQKKSTLSDDGKETK